MTSIKHEFEDASVVVDRVFNDEGGEIGRLFTAKSQLSNVVTLPQIAAIRQNLFALSDAGTADPTVRDALVDLHRAVLAIARYLRVNGADEA